MDPQRYYVLHTTVEQDSQARHLASEAVSRRLAACVQILPVDSIYRWEGELHSAKEFRCEMKTNANCLAPLTSLLCELHPYDVPELVAFPMEGISNEYGTWLMEQLREQ